MEKYIEKVSTLLEALPYIKTFWGKTVVIKFGGNAMVDDDLKCDFARDIVLLKYIGINPIIVHGGGPQIGSLLKELNIESQFHKGQRITDSKTMDIVEMVLVGKVNKEIVNMINKQGGKAIGLSGKDAQLIIAEKMESKDEVDLGRVGRVKQINPEILSVLDKEKFIPVIAPVGIDVQGDMYNINADLVAGAIASSLKAEKLIMLTDTQGIMINNQFVSRLTIKEAQHYIDNGEISGGMIPKVETLIEALKNGVNKVHIINGTLKHSILLELFTDAGIGTAIE